RPFTAEMIARLVVRGVTIAPITLHTGVSSLEGDEEPYPEPYDVPPATGRLVDATRQAGGPGGAVGTTRVGALETAAARPEGAAGGRGGHHRGARAGNGGGRAGARGGLPAARVLGLDAPPGDAANPPEGGGCAVHRTARAALHPSFDAERIRRGRSAPPVLRR